MPQLFPPFVIILEQLLPDVTNSAKYKHLYSKLELQKENIKLEPSPFQNEKNSLEKSGQFSIELASSFFSLENHGKCETKITPLMTKTHLPGRHFPLPTTLGAGPTARDRHVVVLLGRKCRGSTDDVWSNQDGWAPFFFENNVVFLVGRFFEGDSEICKTSCYGWSLGDWGWYPS